MTTSFLVTSALFETPKQDGKPALKMSANKYCLPDAPSDGITLILAHGNGAREYFALNEYPLSSYSLYCITEKEHWEPTLESLLLPTNPSAEAPTVREVWAFDWQDHGDSALLNSDVLSGLKNGICTFAATLS